MTADRYLFTSESVSMGHPDKVADQISDAVLDHCLTADPTSRVACETLVTTDLAVVAGEITTKADLSPASRRRASSATPSARSATPTRRSASPPTPARSTATCTRSRPHIAMGVDAGGAGDQGMMFGFACDETTTLMPLPIYLAHRLVENHAELRESGELKFVRPDAKSQVTVEYNADGTPHRIHTVVLSTQHDESVMATKNGKDYFSDDARQVIIDKLILPTLQGRAAGPASRASCVMVAAGHAGRRARRRRDPLPHQPDRLLPGRRPARRLRPDRAARSSSTPTAAAAGTAAAPSAARTRPRWTARPRTWPATSPRTSSRPAWPTQCEVQLSYAIGYPDPLNIWVNTNGTHGNGPDRRPAGRADPQALQADAEGHHRDAEPAPADLPRDGPARPLRPRAGRTSPGRRPTRPRR